MILRQPGTRPTSTHQQVRTRRTAGSPRRRAASVAAFCGTILLLGGCAFGEPEPDSAGAPPNFPTPSASPSGSGPASGDAVITPLVTGLRVPWGVAFLPDGAALVTERDTRRILKVGPEESPDGLTVTPVQTIAEATSRGEGGLLGIAVSPSYDTDKTIFIYYTTARDNRIAKLTLGGKPRPIVTGIPAGEIHNGGRLAFGPDGYLYATTGDAGRNARSQNARSLGGKILRMTTEGKPAPGNPGRRSLVWSSGVRNSQGIAWDSGKLMYATDFGYDTWDELNQIRRGGNYGWPTVEGRAGNRRFVDPMAIWPVAEASCSGVAVVQRTLLAACLRGQRLWAVELTAQGGAFGQPEPLLVGEYGRLRTVVAAPDGSVWITTSNHDGSGQAEPDDDRILRLVLPGAGGVGQS